MQRRSNADQIRLVLPSAASVLAETGPFRRLFVALAGPAADQPGAKGNCCKRPGQEKNG